MADQIRKIFIEWGYNFSIIWNNCPIKITWFFHQICPLIDRPWFFPHFHRPFRQTNSVDSGVQQSWTRLWSQHTRPILSFISFVVILACAPRCIFLLALQHPLLFYLWLLSFCQGISVSLSPTSSCINLSYFIIPNMSTKSIGGWFPFIPQ